MPLFISPIAADGAVSEVNPWNEAVAANQMPILTIPQLIDLMLLSAQASGVRTGQLETQLRQSGQFNDQLGQLDAQYSPATFLQQQANSFAANFELKYNELMMQVQRLFQEIFYSQRSLVNFVLSETLAQMPKADLDKLQSKFPATFVNLNRLNTYMKVIEHYIGLPAPQQITVKGIEGQKPTPVTAYFTPKQYSDLLYKMGIKNVCFLAMRIKDLSDDFKQINPAQLNIISGISGTDEKTQFAGFAEFEEKQQFKSYQSIVDYWVPRIKQLFNYPVDEDEQLFLDTIDSEQQRLSAEHVAEQAAEQAAQEEAAETAAQRKANEPFKWVEQVTTRLDDVQQRKSGDGGFEEQGETILIKLRDMTQMLAAYLDDPTDEDLSTLRENIVETEVLLSKHRTAVNATNSVVAKAQEFLNKLKKLSAIPPAVLVQLPGLESQLNTFQTDVTAALQENKELETRIQEIKRQLPEEDQEGRPNKKRARQTVSGGAQTRGQSSTGVFERLPEPVLRTLVALMTLYRSALPEIPYSQWNKVELNYDMLQTEPINVRAQVFQNPQTQWLFEQARAWFEEVMITTSRLYAVKYTDVKALQYIASQEQTALLLLPTQCPPSFKTRIADTFKEVQRVNLLQALNELIELRDCDGNLLQSKNREELERTISQIVTESAVNISLYSNSHINVLLTGAAGAGKTRYAQIIAKVMKNCGLLLSPSNIDIVSRPDLVGQYLGQSAPRTKERLFQNLENVMFIDEAYALAQGNVEKGKVEWESYSLEVMNEIVNFLDKYKGRICVIAAGYPQIMFETFMKINEGMPRRFPFKILLPNYSAAELVALCCYFFRKNANLSMPYFQNKATCFLQAVIETFAETLFPNSAGDIENFASIAARRLQSKRTRLQSNAETLSVNDVIDILLAYCKQAQNKLCQFTASPDQIAAVPQESCMQGFQALLQGAPAPAPLAPQAPFPVPPSVAPFASAPPQPSMRLTFQGVPLSQVQ